MNTMKNNQKIKNDNKTIKNKSQTIENNKQVTKKGSSFQEKETLGVLFSGGKDSVYALYLEKKKGNKIACLISIYSENKESYMFHTPSIKRVESQANVLGIPLEITTTKGEKEEELKDLENAIANAKEKYALTGIVTGALASVYQASRIKKICDELGLKSINPLWQKDQFELLNELIKNNFEVILTGVFAYPLDKSWLLRKIDNKFIEDMRHLYDKYKVNPAGEGGEFESFVINCPLFKRKLLIYPGEIFGSKHSYSMEILVE
ncbi:MAG TPA: diphthine--ammonia ligase [Candidatus Woesearchaeota archaeon]|nr:diphthine--ammonia ligase [Candidatus Woesearchaeota archaeon]